MSVSELFGLAEPDAVDDGRMVEGVRENCVFRTHELLKESGVGVEAAGVQDRVLFPVKARYFVLQILKYGQEYSFIFAGLAGL